jgi:hypothetical protein
LPPVILIVGPAPIVEDDQEHIQKHARAGVREFR